MELQNLVSSRLVEKIGHPNLLLDQSLQWDMNTIFTPRLNSQPAGWHQFLIGDRNAASGLGLPVVSVSEGQHLFVLTTGSYGIKRAQVTLTATR